MYGNKLAEGADEAFRALCESYVAPPSHFCCPAQHDIDSAKQKADAWLNRNGDPPESGESKSFKMGLTVGKWPSRFSSGSLNRRRRSSTTGNICRSGRHPNLSHVAYCWHVLCYSMLSAATKLQSDHLAF